MNLFEGGEGLVENERDVVEQQVDELDKEVQVDTDEMLVLIYVKITETDIPCFCREVLTVHGVWPYTLDNLEDLVTDVKLVVELCVGTSALALNVELHQRMQQMLRCKIVSEEGVAEHALWPPRYSPHAMEEDRDQA
jgi:hypothetical protein